VDVVSWSGPPTTTELPTAPVHTRLIKLKSLTIGRHCDLGVLLTWASQKLRLAVLTKLSFLALEPTDIERLSLLLPLVRPGLKELTIGFRFPGIPAEFSKMLSITLNLGSYPRLHTVRLRLLDIQPENLQWVSHLLGTLSFGFNARAGSNRGMNRSITTVIFDIWLFNVYQLQNGEWDKIIETLCEIALYPLPRLTRAPVPLLNVVFVQRGTMEFIEAARAIKERLSFLSGIGVVVNVTNADCAP